MTQISELVLWALFACSSLMVGFSGATISFTAWNLVLPLLLKFFSVELFPALFISVILDFVNSIILTVFYGNFRKVSFTSGFIFSIVSAPVALIVSLTTGQLLIKYRRFLEGGVGYLPFILCVVFFIRGVVTFIKDYKERKKRREMEQLKSSNDNVGQSMASSSYNQDQRELDEIDDGTLESSVNIDDTDLEKHGNMGDQDTCGDGMDEDFSNRDNTPGLTSDGTGTDNNNNAPNTTRMSHYSHHHHHNTMGSKTLSNLSGWRYYLERFSVEPGYGNYMLFSTDFSTKQKIIQGLITCIVMAIVGGISGLVYVGGGMIINVVLAACWRVDQKVATATGCFCTLLCMFVLSLTFVGTPAIFTMQTAYFLIVGVPCCFVGALIGAFLSLRVSNMAIFFTISGVLLVLGIVITVEGQL